MASPIEEQLRAAILLAAPSDRPFVDATGHASCVPENLGMFPNTRKYIEPIVWLDDSDQHERAIYFYRSVSVLTYRADFILETGVRKLAIECDGREFHDRTKQQAAYDRARDRELLQLGIPTIRFTGSEIVHSPERCADDAFRCLLALPDRRREFNDGWDEATAFCIRYYEGQYGIEDHW